MTKTYCVWLGLVAGSIVMIQLAVVGAQGTWMVANSTLLPWAASGQTFLDEQAALDNPLPAKTGAIGAVRRLPYTVPTGRTLCVETMSMEGYDAPGIAVIFLFTGDYPDGATSRDRRLHGTGSAAARNGSSEHTGRFCFPSGVTVNVRLINGQSLSAVYGWQVTGYLEREEVVGQFQEGGPR